MAPSYAVNVTGRIKMQMCNDLCRLIKEKEMTSIYAYNAQHTGMYTNGYKRCSICQINLRIPEYKCPCCHTKMRSTNCRSAKRAITEKARY